MRRILRLTRMMLGISFLLIGAQSYAQSDGYELTWLGYGGGGAIRGGVYEMVVAVGDPAAGEVSGGVYSMGGGILGGGARAVAPVTPTSTPLPPTPTSTENPLPTATPGNPSPTATPTPTLPGNTGVDVQLYLPLVER